MAVVPILLAYYTAWSIYQRAYFVNDIPADKITYINYAFANIDSDGRIAIGDPYADIEKTFAGDSDEQSIKGNFNQLLKLKLKYPHIRTLISVGGASRSNKFSDIALTETNRSVFADSCINFIHKYGFDGIDIDWEYPVSGGHVGNIHRPDDKRNYVLLLKELRQKLNLLGNITGTTYLLTAATGAGTEKIANMDLSAMADYLNWINVMTYAFHGGWNAKTGHNAALYMNELETTSDKAPKYIKSRYNVHAAIQAYIAAGVSRKKLVMGLPLYGRGWQGVNSSILDGFSQPASRDLPMGTWARGVFTYDHIRTSLVVKYKRFWDNSSKVPFLYSQQEGIWISYDDLESIENKMNYIKQQQLGGAMIWELSYDRQGEIISSIHASLKINAIVLDGCCLSRQHILPLYLLVLIFIHFSP